MQLSLFECFSRFFVEMNFVEFKVNFSKSSCLPFIPHPSHGKTTNLSLSILFTNEHIAKRIVFFHDWQNKH